MAYNKTFETGYTYTKIRSSCLRYSTPSCRKSRLGVDVRIREGVVFSLCNRPHGPSLALRLDNMLSVCRVPGRGEKFLTFYFLLERES